MNIDRKALFRINQAMMDLSLQYITRDECIDEIAATLQEHGRDILMLLKSENQALDLWLNEIAKEKAV